MSTLKILALLAAICASLYAYAGPAPWYKWYSLYDGTVICTQTWPG